MSETASASLLPAYIRSRISVVKSALFDSRRAHEAATAWAVFQINWVITAAFWIAFGLCLLVTDFRAEPMSYLVVLSISAIYGYIGYANARSSQRAKPWIFSLLTGISQSILASVVLASLSYIATAANLRLQDANLLAIDELLGYDFRSFLGYVNGRPWIITILAFGYRSISLTIFVIVLALPLSGNYRRLAEFNLASSLALATTCCITLLVPAIGVYHALGLFPSDYPNIVPQAFYDSAHGMILVRDGTLRLLDPRSLAGIVTFPSYHAAAAVLDCWALWPVRWLRPFNAFTNGAMLLSTPIGGGHYLVDVIAGIIIAIVTILAARSIACRQSDRIKAASLGGYSS
ncbi:phosphatase PAP2 family protein [Bradyrhizobium sp. HKCCYLRH3099]|uniref:phosphatase PAP2 family protein n=1 Tax=unclassified Bradyrhizobium TaxID=2631580 RepID=UPI003EBBD19C